jgi:hypothetical protein
MLESDGGDPASGTSLIVPTKIERTGYGRQCITNHS